MPIVRIIGDRPARYVVSNFTPPVEYDPGEIYDVLPHVANGLVAHGQAKIVSGAELNALLKAAEQPSPPPAVEKTDEEPKERKRGYQWPAQRGVSPAKP